MTVSEFIADAQAKAESVAAKIRAFFEAHPDLESDAAADLKTGIDTLGTVAQATVEHDAPASAQTVLDEAIAAIQAKADTDAAAIQADAQAHIAALQTAKAAVPA